MSTWWQRAEQVLAVSTVAVAIACASDPKPGAPNAEGGVATPTSFTAARGLAQIGAPQILAARRRGAAPDTVAQVIERTRFAFKADQDRFNASFGSWSAQADGRGFAVTPLPLAPHETVIPAVLRTESWQRGVETWRTPKVTAWRSEAGGGVVADRGAATERVRGRQAGVEVSWTWASAPAGEGDLVVRVSLDGPRFDRATQGGLHFVDDVSGRRLRFSRATWIDADGREADVQPTWDRGEIVLRVPSDVLAASSFPAVLDPTVGAESAVDAPIIAAIGEITDPSVADDGTNFLVVWSDARTEVDEVYGVRVAPTGVPIDSVGFHIRSGTNPDVTFDGTKYLVSTWSTPNSGTSSVTTAGVASGLSTGSLTGCSEPHNASQTSTGTTLVVAYCGGPVYGRIVGGSSFQIAAAGDYDTDVAYSSSGGDFVVVTRTSTRLDAYRVSTAGVVTGPYNIYLGPSTLDLAVGCGGAACLVVWETSSAGVTTLNRVTLTGTTIGVTGTLRTNGGNPSIAYDGTNFVVAYHLLTNTSVQLQKITTAGAVTGSELQVATAADLGSRPQLSFEDGRSLVVWENDLDSTVKGMRVTTAFALEDAAPLGLSRGNNREREVAVASDGAGYLATWVDQRDQLTAGWEIYATRLSGTGVPLDSPALHISTPSTPWNFDLVAGYGGGSYLVANRVYSSRLATRTVSPGGTLGTEQLRTESMSAPRDIAFDGTRYLLSSGYFVTAAGVATPSGTGNVESVVWDGANFVLAYVSGSDVYVKRATSAGVILDPSGVNVTVNGTGSASAPVLASNGQGSVVTWTDTRSGAGDVYGARLTQALGVTDANGVNLSNNASAEVNGDLIWDGTAYLSTWSRGSSGADLVITWLKTDGTTTDASGIVVASDTNADLSPALASRGSGQSLIAYHRQSTAEDEIERVYARVIDAGLVLGSACAAGSQCASRVCTDGVCCAVASCGTCQECSPLSGACENVAGQDDDDSCTGASTCSAGSQCRLKNGQSCASSAVCASGYCVDGVCCDQACGGTCQACTTAKKGSGTEGVCGAILAGSDPDAECAATASTTCGTDGSCSGSSSCRLWPASTPCGVTSCTGGVQTGFNCNGAGTCQPGASTPCSPYACANATACATTCAADADCASTHYCDATNHCVAQEPIAHACDRARVCQSGACTDGVCCDGVCNGLCQACTAAKKGTGTDGACGPILSGTDPDDECATQAATTCGTTGACGGTGTCALYANGTTCGSTTCGAGVQTGYSCTGSGTCLAGSSTPCFPYLCANASSCATSCSADSQCDAAYYCRGSDSSCQPKLASGACTRSAMCQSGNCADGVCCDTACAGTCVACTAAKKLAGADGVCGPVLTGTDPDNECAPESQASCGRDGACGGSGACSFWSLGTSCATSCSGAQINDSICNGSGQCTAGSTTSCNGYQCASGTTCRTTCTGDGDCVAAYWCRTSDGTCQADQGVGSVCTAAGQCTSGNCVDGVCCDTACNGTCQACTALEKGAGTDGTCGAVADGRDPHASCADQGASSCGTDGACDGSGVCRKYAAGVSCGATSCVGNSVKGRICNGLGACQDDPNGVDCAPYLCQSSACTNPCGSEQDCTVGNYCDAGTCKPKKLSPASCVLDVECQSSSCADGVCCDTACAGPCVACTAALKGSGSDGVCGAIAGGTDPDAECAATAPTSCGLDGTCDGSGACALHAAGTACATACAGSTLTASTCNGGGQCLAGTTTPCGPYRCASSTSCGTTCAADGDCEASAWCRTSDGTCQPDLPTGGACGSTSQCQSGYCVDGVCCDTACTGSCRACSAAEKDSGSDGVCGNAGAGRDPHSDCPQDAAASCGRDGQCDGAGQCRNYVQGTACGATTCVGGSVRGQICNGLGQCTTDSVGTACAPYACSGTVCANPCAGNVDCIAGNYCDLGTCRPLLTNGGACTTGDACQTHNCVDGVCCDTACIGSCTACSAAKKGGGSDGACGAIVDGQDPDNECAVTNPTGCGTDGQCDGAAACRLYPRGTACGTSQCNGNRAVGSLCDGFGGCGVDPLGVECSPYACTGGSCPSACGGDAECAVDFWCDAGACVAKGLPGSPCTSAVACAGDFCVDGVCCDAACSGQCEACDVAGSEGTCTAVGGAPHGTRAPCTGSDPTCGGNCNGTQRAACTFPPSSTVCGTPACSGGVAHSSLCDGAGTCAAQPDVVCSPFVCGGDACKTACSSDPDCAQGFHCDTAGGECVPSTGKCVDGNTGVEDSAGNVTPCAPYFCSGGECRDTCDVSTDCASGYVCSEQHCSRRQSAAESADDGGCGCRAAGTRRDASTWLALSAAVGLVLVRRRRASRRVAH